MIVQILIVLINIYCQPIAQFSFQNVCLDSTILFEDQSIYQDSDSAWLWVFGDGNTSILQKIQNIHIQAAVHLMSVLLLQTIEDVKVLLTLL